MATLPLLLFPRPASVDRSKLPSLDFPRPTSPSLKRQGERLTSKFETLFRTLDAGRLVAQRDAAAEDPDLVLVVETIGAVEDFINSANRIAGLEWLFGSVSEQIEPDDDFFYADQPDKKLGGKLFLLSTTRRALEEILQPKL